MELYDSEFLFNRRQADTQCPWIVHVAEIKQMSAVRGCK